METLFPWLVTALSLLLTILNIINLTTVLKSKADKPLEDLIARVERLEKKSEACERNSVVVDERLEEVETTSKVLLRGVSALLGHSIDGNNIEEMQTARAELNNCIYGK